MSNNGLPEGMTAGEWLDVWNKKMLCFIDGKATCKDPEQRKTAYRAAVARYHARQGQETAVASKPAEVAKPSPKAKEARPPVAQAAAPKSVKEGGESKQAAANPDNRAKHGVKTAAAAKAGFTKAAQQKTGKTAAPQDLRKKPDPKATSIAAKAKSSPVRQDLQLRKIDPTAHLSKR